MISVLFVCLGNICRSPMAEAVFRHEVSKVGLAGQFKIDSCGTGGWHEGEPPHEGTRSLLNEKGISWKGQTARKITKQDFFDFEHIVAMDRQNVRDIVLFAAKQGIEPAHISLLLDYLPAQTLSRLDDKDVPDPYYTGDFESVYSLVYESATNLLNRISPTLK